MQMRWRHWALVWVATICIGSWAPAAMAVEFKFTAIPDEDTARLETRFNRVATYLADKLEMPVSYIPVKSYSASVEAFKNNQVQLAWFGGLSGVKARMAVPGSMAIAQGEEDKGFITYFIAHTSTGLSLAEAFPLQIEGRTFTFGSKGSTSGRLMPEYFIRQQFGRSPREVFRRVGFSGDHSKTIALVQSGSFEVGAVNYKVWQNEVAAGRVDPAKVNVIWRTPAYPDYNWTIRGDADQAFGQGFIQKVRQALVQMNDPDLLAAFPRAAFIRADNSMYRPILETGRQIGVIRR